MPQVHPLTLVSMHLIDSSPLGKQRQQIQGNDPADKAAWLSVSTQSRSIH